MSHEPRGPKYDRQEPVGSTSDCLTLLPKEIRPKSNRQEPKGSKSNPLTIVLKNICHMLTQNKITAPFINNMNGKDITQKCNGLHQKYIDITGNM